MKRFSKQPGKAVPKTETKTSKVDQKVGDRVSEKAAGLLKYAGNMIASAKKTAWDDRKSWCLGPTNKFQEGMAYYLRQ